MKLLMLIHRLPCPPDRGIKLRSAAQIRWLAARHDVWCAGFIERTGVRPEVDRSVREAASMCRGFAAFPLAPAAANWRGACSMLAGGTATEGYFHSRRLERQVLEWADSVGFDAVLASSSSMAPLALKVRARRRVLDFVDLDSRKWESLSRTASWPMRRVYGLEGRRLARREIEWLGLCDAGVLVNEREAELLRGSAMLDRIHVIENASEVSADDPDRSGLPEKPVVGFVGAMDYQPNVDAACWFADSMWPRIRSAVPPAEWYIVGRSPARAIQRLDDGRSVHVTGTVPAVEPYLRRMRVNVAPLRLARGLQTKVVTAMAAGRPCVVTPCVADGIGAAAGKELIVAESPEDFADAVVGLLSDRARAEAIGEAGRAYVAGRFSAESCMGRMESLLIGGTAAVETAMRN